jgi:histidine triad (HIT) family protein
MVGVTEEPDAGPCVFCEIVAGRGEASVVYEDDRALSFMDIRPVTSGHLLVVPKVHAARLDDLDEGLGRHVFGVAHRVARAMYRSGLPCEGVNLFLADGVAAGQEVFHVHVHVLPRTRGDGFRIEASWSHPDRAALDAVAAQIRATVRA